MKVGDLVRLKPEFDYRRLRHDPIGIVVKAHSTPNDYFMDAKYIVSVKWAGISPENDPFDYHDTELILIKPNGVSK